MPANAPEVLVAWMRPFRVYFTAAAWRRALTLAAGTPPAPGRRTVTAAPRVMGLERTPGFAVYHRPLSRGRWSSRALAHRLLPLPVAAFVPDGPVVVGLDATIERRWGARIRARGIHRDPVRSSHGHFVEASGLRRPCVMPLAPVPWAGCVRGLPFPTVPAPSERHAARRGRRHKELTDRARRAPLQVARRPPGRRVVAVAAGGFAAVAPLRDLAPHLAVVTRPRLDACPCQPPPPRRPGKTGRPPVKGARLPSLAKRLRDPATPWRRIAIDGWYGRTERRLDIATGAALWRHPGMRVAIRWGPAQRAERCAARSARRSRGPSCAPTPAPTPWRSRAGSSAAGGPRPPSRKRGGGASAWRPGASGPTSPSCARHRRCPGCSRA